MESKRQFYLFYAAFGVIGGGVVVDALISIGDGGFSIPLGLVFVGGAGMVLTAAYEVLTADPPTFSANGDSTDRPIVVLGVGALLALVGLALRLLG